MRRRNLGSRGPQRRRLGVLMAAAALTLTACDAGSTESGSGSGSGPEEAAEAFGHVHGLGVNPADGRLYVATHFGVFRETSSGFTRIADRWQDTMSFTVAGPDHFLASGHPDLREDQPPHLGLIESTDGARTWTALSLEGQADFHILELGGDRIYAYDSQTATLKMTSDRQSWTDVLATPLLDVEADPADPDLLVMSDDRGVLMSLRVGQPPVAVAEAPRVGLIDWPSPDLLVGIGGAGEVWVSRDGTETWEQTGVVPGAAQALTVADEEWYVATESGVFSSTDEGATWRRLDAT